MTLADWASVATIVTGVGVVVSIFLSIRALREVQEDRRFATRPYLSFEPGGYMVPVVFVRVGRRIPGVEPSAVEAAFPLVAENAEAVQIKDREDGPCNYGELRNLGSGPALEVSVTWYAEDLGIGSETFYVDGTKRRQPLYGPNFNEMPSLPSHIAPGDRAQMSRLPTFIDKDVERKLATVEGYLALRCLDVQGRKHLAHQKFRIETAYRELEPHVWVTFGDMLPERWTRTVVV
jgi:hypothetical protein